MTYHLRLKGFVGGWDFDSDYAQYILDKYPDTQVNVCIDSMGGRLNTALSISAAFKAHGNVHVHYVSMNASAATIASLGAKHVSIDRDGWYLVHKASFNVCEYADMNEDKISEFIKTLEEAKAQLAKYDLGIAKAYARRCKKDPKDLYALMEKETFLSAEEALEWGFVDEITDNPEDSQPILDEITLNYCRQNKIEIPQALMAFRKGSDTADPSDPGFIDRIVASVKSAFTPKTNDKMNTNPTSEKADEKEKNPASQNSQSSQSSQDSQDSQNSQPEANANADDIAAMRAEIENLKAENSDLKAKLDKRPADSHTQVIDEKKEAIPDNTIRTNLTKSARSLLDSIC